MSIAKRFGRGDFIFRQGDAPGAMYILLEGALSIVVDGVTLATVNEFGSFVGEISFLLNKPRVADVVASADTKVMVVTDLEAFMLQDPSRAIAIARDLARRLDAMDQDVIRLRRALAEGDTDDPTAATAAGREVSERLHREAGIA